MQLVENSKEFFSNLHEYLSFLQSYFLKKTFRNFYRFEKGKGFLIDGLSAKRGKYIRPFLHSSMIGLFIIGLMLAPLIRSALPEQNLSFEPSVQVLSALSLNEATTTQVSVKPRDSVVTYKVQEGDTLSSIALKFGVSEETIQWQDDLEDDAVLKIDQKLEIPPVTGMIHKVKRGETIHSIAKKYSVDPQQIVNWPFNSFTNDETFALAVGQLLVVPEGIKPKALPAPEYLAQRYRQTPSAGAVSATGDFAWPTFGGITQYFVWYHPAVDIANRDAPDVVAADSGRIVLVSYQKYAYGNHVIIDHGNGFSTLYAHLSSIYVNQGQTVVRGNAIGRMGSTGRSTGIHLHFEIRLNGVAQNPLSYLK
ncbi:MAG TPA: M23 family metallopeptidase [Candidatus Bathyarchaeia archaeon]|nr:M23 family metallopeptidase [Candidatus Bathyarchaeia archaeon]